MPILAASTALPRNRDRVRLYSTPLIRRMAMARLTRRAFVATSGAIAAAPALTLLTPQAARAQGPAPDSGNLKVLEKDVVFGKGGTMDMKLDVYGPPDGV